VRRKKIIVALYFVQGEMTRSPRERDREYDLDVLAPLAVTDQVKAVKPSSHGIYLEEPEFSIWT
jgi:hypothetical protein